MNKMNEWHECITVENVFAITKQKPKKLRKFFHFIYGHKKLTGETKTDQCYCIVDVFVCTVKAFLYLYYFFKTKTKQKK